MANINNLNTPNIPKLEQRVRAVESGAPMNNAAVGRSGFEVYDNGTINVSSGNIIGAGTFSWQGSFSQSGTSILSGSTTIAGPTGITGQLTIQGATSVTGPFTVTGATRLNGVTDVGGAFTVTGVTKLNGATTVGGDFEIAAGGLFKAGQSSIKPDGSAKFGLFDIAANGNLSSKGTLAIDGVTTLKSDLNVTTGGKITAGQLIIDPTTNGGTMRFPNNQYIYASSTRLVASSLHLTGTLEVQNAVIFKGLQATTQAANVFYDVTTGTLRYRA